MAAGNIFVLDVPAGKGSHGSPEKPRHSFVQLKVCLRHLFQRGAYSATYSPRASSPDTLTKRAGGWGRPLLHRLVFELPAIVHSIRPRRTNDFDCVHRALLGFRHKFRTRAEAEHAIPGGPRFQWVKYEIAREFIHAFSGHHVFRSLDYRYGYISHDGRVHSRFAGTGNRCVDEPHDSQQQRQQAGGMAGVGPATGYLGQRQLELVRGE